MSSFSLKHAILSVILFLLVQGCTATPDSSSLNWPVYEPLVNGKLVTIEVIHVNGSQCPGESMEQAIEGFSKYVAGQVRTVQGKPIELKVDSEGLLSEAQLAPVIAKRRYRGASDITIIVVGGLSDFPGRGFLRHEIDGSHVIVIQSERLRKGVPPFVSKEKWAHRVIKHELCHTLGVPGNKSHAWSDGHCTRGECILSTVSRFRPPMDLCTLCQQEIHEAHLLEGDKLVNPDQPHDQAELLKTIVKLNPDNPRALLFVAEQYALAKNHKRATEILKEHIRLHPDDDRALNLFAWTLGTCSDDDVRDGPLAVELAKRACSLTDWKDHWIIDTLAAGYAEAGQFDLAIEFQKKAIGLVDGKQTESYLRRLKLYRSRTPYRVDSR